MRLSPSTLALPAFFLFLVVSSSDASFAAEGYQSPTIQRPYGFPAHVKFFPEDPPSRRRDLEAIQEHVLAGHVPVAVRKMSGDENEKFFPEYWSFVEPGGSSQISLYKKDDEATSSNTSLPKPAFALHTDKENSLTQQPPLDSWIRAVGARSPAIAMASLEKRGFQCPGGTAACTSVGYPNLCCGAGDGCFLITDTGLGPVGCCPLGATCGGTVTSCEENNVPCPSKLGGGCCLPGFTCANEGCVRVALTVVITITTTISASSTQIVLTTTTTPPVTTASVSSTLASTNSGASARSQTTLPCPSGDQACPAALGGGCCPANLVCMAGNSCAFSSGTTASAVAPVRQTTDGAAISTTNTLTSSVVITDDFCPTGYYACSAQYLSGGCCRVGRDCHTTDCPSVASTTLVSGDVTIAVPLTSAAPTAAGGTCPTGWYSCATSLGGSCCPNEWTCGTESCTLIGPSSTSVEGKNGTLSDAAHVRLAMTTRALRAAAILLLVLV